MYLAAFEMYKEKKLMYDSGVADAPNTNCLSILRLFYCGI